MLLRQQLDEREERPALSFIIGATASGVALFALSFGMGVPLLLGAGAAMVLLNYGGGWIGAKGAR